MARDNFRILSRHAQGRFRYVGYIDTLCTRCAGRVCHGNRAFERLVDLDEEQACLALDVCFAPSEPESLGAVKLRHQALYLAAVTKQIRCLSARLTDHHELGREHADERCDVIADLCRRELLRSGKVAVSAHCFDVSLRNQLRVRSETNADGGKAMFSMVGST